MCSALQVISFYSWEVIPPAELLAVLNSSAPGVLRAWWVDQVPRSFHATFSAEWRRYVYLFPLRLPVSSDGPSNSTQDSIHLGLEGRANGDRTSGGDGMGKGGELRKATDCTEVDRGSPVGGGCSNGDPETLGRCPSDGSSAEYLWVSGSPGVMSDINVQTAGHDNTGAESSPKVLAFDPKPIDNVDVTVEDVDQLLRSIEGQTLDFYSFARDTPKGKDCVCQIIHSRASTAFLPSADSSDSLHPSTVPVMCVELVANRFLRRMARIVVSTAIRESIVSGARKGGDKEALIQLAESCSRLETAIGAPPQGLCLAGVGYEGRGLYGGLAEQ